MTRGIKKRTSVVKKSISSKKEKTTFVIRSKVSRKGTWILTSFTTKFQKTI